MFPVTLLMGTGAGLCFPALMTLAMSSATPQDAGLASGLQAYGGRAAGVLFALDPWRGAAAAASWLVVARATRYASLASIFAGVLAPLPERQVDGDCECDESEGDAQRPERHGAARGNY